MGKRRSGVDSPPDMLRASLDGLATEVGGDAGADYDLRSTRELVERMADEDAVVSTAVKAAAGAIAELVDAVASRLRAGGRLVYVGAGSSGRIAALDASECESTFSTPPGTVVALLAGDLAASAPEQEAAEDDAEAGAAAVAALGVGTADVVVGVSASGRTPYVLGAIGAASEAGALTGCVVAVEGSELAASVEHAVVVVVGPEFLAGSTRLKAGTAQKLVLNTVSTLVMVRLGKTYGNLMVDVAATNDKLRARVRRIVETATGADAAEVERALEDADGEAKVAIVALLANVPADESRERLAASRGSIRRAVDG
ncbi:MAG TPA: N-acetylmuramic acid 6-phosphate etherase [Gaiellaceae bacterium]|nr:N-acetylmuramic acid 6-phosphate etherase [Gaiellaceae bacterium]